MQLCMGTTSIQAKLAHHSMCRKTYESQSLSHNHVAVSTHFVPQYTQSHKYEHVCHGLRCKSAAASVANVTHRFGVAAHRTSVRQLHRELRGWSRDSNYRSSPCAAMCFQRQGAKDFPAKAAIHSYLWRTPFVKPKGEHQDRGKGGRQPRCDSAIFLKTSSAEGVHGETMDFSCQINLDLGIPCSLSCLLVVPSSGLRCLIL